MDPILAVPTKNGPDLKNGNKKMLLGLAFILALLYNSSCA
jgi:hypothetical protein